MHIKKNQRNLEAQVPEDTIHTALHLALALWSYLFWQLHSTATYRNTVNQPPEKVHLHGFRFSIIKMLQPTSSCMLLRVCTELIHKEQTCWVKRHMHRKGPCIANTGTYCHTALQGIVPMDTPISNTQEARFCKYFYGFYFTSKSLVHLEYVSRIYENRPQLTLKRHKYGAPGGLSGLNVWLNLSSGHGIPPCIRLCACQSLLEIFSLPLCSPTPRVHMLSK